VVHVVQSHVADGFVEPFLVVVVREANDGPIQLPGAVVVLETERKSTRLDQLRGQAQKLRKLTVNLDQLMQAGQYG